MSRASRRLRDYQSALREITSTLGLGPCEDVMCSGCEFEFRDAALIARGTLLKHGDSWARWLDDARKGEHDEESRIHAQAEARP